MSKRRFAFLLLLSLSVSGHSLYGQANAAAPQAAGQTGQNGETQLNNSVQMLTPDDGVNFTPYLNRAQSAVKRNWFAVIPESARLGEKGRVVLRFSILRDGTVPAAAPALENTSGKEPLDRAALASIRASSPFEPLPAAFKGEQIELRFIFLYNLPANASPGGVIGGVIGGLPASTNLPPPPPSPPKARLQRVRMGGTVMQGLLVNMVPPIYPPLAKQAQIAGTVRLHVIVAKDGTIQELEVISGHPLLIQAALDAVRQWKYQPVLLNGEAVEVETVVDVIFSLDKKQSKKN